MKSSAMSSTSAKDVLGKYITKAKAVIQNLSVTAVKAQEATNNEPWGPHGAALQQIADGCYTDAEKFKEVWDVLKKRMVEGVGDKWRMTYKSLLVIEFLVKQSSQHVVQVVLENAGLIQDLQKFQYKDEAGKDWGLNVRNRAKELCALLGNPDRIREERAKAKANKDKYKGVGRAAVEGGFAGFTDGSGRGSENRIGDGGGRTEEEVFHRHPDNQGGSSMQREEAAEDPMVATNRRIDSLKQSGAIGREGPAAAASSCAAPAIASVVDGSGFDAFPDEQPVAAAAKPSLRALTESKKTSPKKLGDVRVNPNIAASFGGIKVAPPPAFAPAPASPKTSQAPAAALPQPTAAVELFDAFADFNGSAAAPTSTINLVQAAATAAPSVDDPFAVLSANRHGAPASLADAILCAHSTSKPVVGANPFGSNPFGAPTFSLTATAVAAPLPEHMFTAPAIPVYGGYTAPAVGTTSSGAASPSRSSGMHSPAMKGSPAGVGRPAVSPVVSPVAAAKEDPFSAFNPFK